jgi:hypothetical protein
MAARNPDFSDQRVMNRGRWKMIWQSEKDDRLLSDEWLQIWEEIERLQVDQKFVTGGRREPLNY